MVALCDYVVAALPYTPATHEIVNRAVIDAMRPTAVFINVGRGKTVEEPALIEGRSVRCSQGGDETKTKLHGVCHRTS